MRTTAPLNYNFQLSNEHVREDADGSLIVSGFASNFDVDRVGDTVTRAALDRALTGYMRNPVLLYDHKYAQPAGVVTKARVDERGLWIEAKLPRPDAGLPRHYWDLVKTGVMRALSIGGVWKRDALRRLIEIDLREISVAAVGVNSGTLLSAQTAKAFGDDDPADRELSALREAGALLERLGPRLDAMIARENARGYGLASGSRDLPGRPGSFSLITGLEATGRTAGLRPPRLREAERFASAPLAGFGPEAQYP